MQLTNQLRLDSMLSLLYALHVLRSHGLLQPSVKDVFQATVLAETCMVRFLYRG